MKKAISLLFGLSLLVTAETRAQDTFSIVAVDSVTGEVGSAGASCLDLLLFFPNYATDFLGDLIPGVGAINTQANYNATNQANARARMLAGNTPQQIINWLTANDIQNNNTIRQYGIAALVNGSPQTAGFTGANTLNYKNHVAGPNYCIQGNILLNQSILDSMESRFVNTPGNLACKLMAALQGANVVGADTRCAANNTSSLFAFLKVSQPSDPIGSPSLLVSVKTPGGFSIEPIDSLQILFDAVQTCTTTSLPESAPTEWTLYPNPAGDFVMLQAKGKASAPSATTYRLLDAAGQSIREGRIMSLPYPVNTANLKSGVYMLELRSDSQVRYLKVVKE